MEYNCSNQRHCKVCGEIITGRSDKMFCSYSCRVYYNNIEYRKRKLMYPGNQQVKKISTTLHIIQERNCLFLLKIVLFVAQVCKIISTFGRKF